MKFMVEYNNKCTPLEVKAGKHVTFKSLDVYKNHHKVDFVFRTNQKNFGMNNEIKYIPLYAIFCRAKELFAIDIVWKHFENNNFDTQ